MAESSKPALEKESTTAVDPQAVPDKVRAPRLEEKEEFDALYQAHMQAEDVDQWVVYRPIPGLDYREISIADWKKSGVDVEESQARYVRWDAKNNWRLPRQMLDFLSDSQFDQKILGDGRFHVVDNEDDLS